MASKFGSFVHSGEQNSQHAVERVIALRPKGVQWSWGEVSPLTRIMIASSAYLVGPDQKSPSGMDLEYFEQSYSEAFVGLSTAKAHDLAVAGVRAALQEHVVLSAALFVPSTVAIDSVQAIADITRTPNLTDQPLDDFKTAFAQVHSAHPESGHLQATLDPLRTLSLQAVRSLRD